MTEEESLFPKIEEVTGVKDIMAESIEQHRLLESGLIALLNYSIMTCVEEYRAPNLQKIIDGFGDTLQSHLHDEIDALLSLEKYDSNALRRAWEETHQYVSKTCNYVTTYPHTYYPFGSNVCVECSITDATWVYGSNIWTDAKLEWESTCP
jgi:hypothetical protein